MWLCNMCKRFLDCSIDREKATLTYSGKLELLVPCPKGMAPGLTAQELRALKRFDLLGNHGQGGNSGSSAGGDHNNGETPDDHTVMCVPLKDLSELAPGILYFSSESLV